MSATAWVTKGSRVEAIWFQADDPPGRLAGAMPKTTVTERRVTGVVRHVRGDHPTSPTFIRLFVDPDPECGWSGPLTRPPGCTCPSAHVEVDPDDVVAADTVPW